MEPFLIDVHHHFVPPRYVAAVEKFGVTGAGGVLFPAWQLERSLAMMDRHAIRTALLSLSTPGIYFGDMAFTREMARYCNEYAAYCVAEAPERFGFFATLPLPDVDASLQELEYAFDTLHADGVGLLSNYAGIYPGDPAFEALFAQLHQRQAVVFIHPTASLGAAMPQGHNFGSPLPALPSFVLEFPFDTTRVVANLLVSGTLSRYPAIRFLLSHAGGAVPFLAAKIALATTLPADFTGQVDLEAANEAKAEAEHTAKQVRQALTYLQQLYFDTALSANPAAFAALGVLTPSSHLLFGSDYPFAPESAAIIAMQGVQNYQPFDDQARQSIAHDNAIALFPRLQNRQL
jgi:predicted TIM-barrel fold metal-dependent hydrolase